MNCKAGPRQRAVNSGASIGNGAFERFLFPLFLAWAVIIPVYAQYELDQVEANFYRKNGFILLAGEQGGEYPVGKYLVTKDVTVERGKTLIFFAGTQLYFIKNTRLNVEGKLECKGTKEKPVFLKRLENQKYFFPLDDSIDPRWDGIIITERASATLEFTHIENSKFGLEAYPDFTGVKLELVVFDDNKFNDLKIAGEVIETSKGLWFSYDSKNPPPKKVSLQYPDSLKPPLTQPPVSQKPRNRPALRVLQIGMGTIAVGTAVAGITSYKQYRDYNSQYPQELNDSLAYLYRNKGNKALKTSNICNILAGVSAIGFIITFFF